MSASSDEILVERASRYYLDALPTWQSKYEEYTDGYNYLAGDQYTPKRKEWYTEQYRPTNIFNILLPIFNQVLGDFILNDQKTQVFPKEGGNPRTAAAIVDMNDFYDDEHDIKAVFLKTALAGLINTGVLYPRYSDEKVFGGDLLFTNIDEFELIYDTRCKEMMADDYKWLIRSNWFTREDLIHFFPEHRAKFIQFLESEKDKTYLAESEYMMNNMNHPEFINEFEGKYRLFEYQETTWDKAEIALNTSTGQGEIFQLEGEKADFFLKTHPEIKLVTRRVKVKTDYKILPTLNLKIDERRAPIQDGTPDYIIYNAYPYGRRMIDSFGLFRNAKGPQKDFNDWRNTLHDAINKVVNPGHTYKPDLLENPEAVELWGRRPGINFQVKNAVSRLDDAIKKNDITKLPFAPDQMSQESAEFLMKITGVTPNFLGVSETRQEPATLFAQRVNQAKVALAVIYDSWQRTKKRFYEKRLSLMQKYITYERYYPIRHHSKPEPKVLGVNVQSEQAVADEIVNDINVGKYGVAIESMDRNPAARSMRFMQKTEVVQTILSMFGGAMVNPASIAAIMEWWLSESDLGDIDDFLGIFIQSLTGMYQQQQDTQEFAEGTAAVEKLLDLAGKQKTLMESENGKGQGGNGKANVNK